MTDLSLNISVSIVQGAYFKMPLGVDVYFVILILIADGILNAAFNICPTYCLFVKPLVNIDILSNEHNAIANIF